jgi:hypothetical protein
MSVISLGAVDQTASVVASCRGVSVWFSHSGMLVPCLMTGDQTRQLAALLITEADVLDRFAL